MTDSHAEDDYARHLAEAIDRNARDIDRLCADRLKSLTKRLSSEQQPYPRGHLTTLRRPIHFLAMQTIDPQGHPSMHPQAGGLTEPYRDRLARYLKAVEDINAVIERAVESGELVVRNASTGIPMQALPARASEPALAFSSAIRTAEAARPQVFRAAAELLLGLPLLDHLPHEGVAVRLAEFDEWAARAGIAEAGEVAGLLREADDRMWEGELALHAALEREAQDTELDEATREHAASELSHLRALAVERGRLPAAVNDAAAEPGDTDPPPDGPPAAALARDSDSPPLAGVDAAPATGTEAPVNTPPVAAMPPAIPAPVIADAFGASSLNGWDGDAWARNMGDGRAEWLKKARVCKGMRGGPASTWNPITIALHLQSTGVAWFKLDAIFKMAAFREWREQWEQRTELIRE